MTEIYRSHDGRWSIYREVDRYVVYDELTARPPREAWSTSTLTQLYQWMAEHDLAPDDFEETS